MSRFLTQREHRGYCSAHGRYKCAACTKADRADERRDYEWGLFEWRGDGDYRRGMAIRILQSRHAAEKAADKLNETPGGSGNVVVRSVRRET